MQEHRVAEHLQKPLEIVEFYSAQKQNQAPGPSFSKIDHFIPIGASGKSLKSIFKLGYEIFGLVVPSPNSPTPLSPHAQTV